MRRVITLVFVIGLLLIGAYFTAQSARGVTLLKLSDPLPPEASVYSVTPAQKAALLAAVVGVGVATLCTGTALAVSVRQLDKHCRAARSEETDSAASSAR